MSNDLKMSLWVDDITLSGETIPPPVIWTIKQIIHAEGLRYHKVLMRHRHLGAIVTGYYLYRDGVAAANKHHLGTRDSLAQLDAATSSVDRLKLVTSLIGKTNHARGIYLKGSAVRSRLDSRRDWLHAERRSLEAERFISLPSHPLIPQAIDDPSLPWSIQESPVHTDFLKDLSVMHFTPSAEKYFGSEDRRARDTQQGQ